MRIFRALFTLGFLLLLPTIVSAQKVTTDFDHNANFSQYKTFMWLREPRVKDPLMRPRIVDAVNSQLTAKGLRLVTDGADLGRCCQRFDHAGANPPDALQWIRRMGLARLERWVRHNLPGNIHGRYARCRYI